MKFFIGPMSLNVIDSIIEFCNENKTEIGLIPSRRQIDIPNGYVNNWSTQDLFVYVKYKTKLVKLIRDHAGPNQGQINDDGYVSLQEDCKYMDCIHIDPWKLYPIYNDGLNETIKMINFCYDLNPNIIFEIGTEESIRKFTPNELENLIIDLKQKLNFNIFNQIKYIVIQSGTSLKGTKQTGFYDTNRLSKMLDIANKYNLISKEHNGDYINIDIINQKFNLGLQSINIAPEFGLIETETYLSEINDDKIFDLFWLICYNSKKWTKWVDSGFDPIKNKKQLIRICGHYILSNETFLSEIKTLFPNIDNKIKLNIKKKLNTLYGY